MIRLFLVAAVVGVIAWSIARWRRERREDTLARARAAFFLQPREPLVPRREPPPMQEVALDGGRLRFRVPASWSGQVSSERSFEARASSARRLRVELREAPGGLEGPVEQLADALWGSGPLLERVVRVLPGDRVLAKHLGTDRTGDTRELTYRWELWAPQLRAPTMAEFCFRVPDEALDAITEDDVRLLEREIQAATLSDPT